MSCAAFCFPTFSVIWGVYDAKHDTPEEKKWQKLLAMGTVLIIYFRDNINVLYILDISWIG